MGKNCHYGTWKYIKPSVYIEDSIFSMLSYSPLLETPWIKFQYWDKLLANNIIHQNCKCIQRIQHVNSYSYSLSYSKNDTCNQEYSLYTPSRMTTLNNIVILLSSWNIYATGIMIHDISLIHNINLLLHDASIHK